LRSRLLAEGFPIIDGDLLACTRRFYTDDPWGNRLEFVERPSPKG